LPLYWVKPAETSKLIGALEIFSSYVDFLRNDRNIRIEAAKDKKQGGMRAALYDGTEIYSEGGRALHQTHRRV
jgi:hypothetical protein